MREAYIALGHKPERRLFERMEAARVREQRLEASKRRRQTEALIAIKAAEVQVARDQQRQLRRQISSKKLMTDRRGEHGGKRNSVFEEGGRPHFEY